jgi:ABC-type Fe3+/spermidine/putrescine transport system ATPase subunit
MVEGQKVRLGIRAESVKLSEVRKGPGVNSFPGVVKNAVFLGEYIDCEVIVHDQPFNVKVSPEFEVSVGSHVSVSLPPGSWVVLPRLMTDR